MTQPGGDQTAPEIDFVIAGVSWAVRIIGLSVCSVAHFSFFTRGLMTRGVKELALLIEFARFTADTTPSGSQNPKGCEQKTFAEKLCNSATPGSYLLYALRYTTSRDMT